MGWRPGQNRLARQAKRQEERTKRAEMKYGAKTAAYEAGIDPDQGKWDAVLGGIDVAKDVIAAKTGMAGAGGNKNLKSGGGSGDDEQSDQPQPKKNNNMIIIIVVAIVAFMMMKKK